MTAVTQRLPYDEIREQTAQMRPARPGHAIATVITAMFVAAGWIIGASVWSVRFCAVAVRYGYRQGARIQRVPSEPQRTAHAEELSKL